MKRHIEEEYYTDGLIFALELGDALFVKTDEGWFVAEEEPEEIHVNRFDDLDLEEVYIFGSYRLIAKIVDERMIEELEERYREMKRKLEEDSREWFEF